MITFKEFEKVYDDSRILGSLTSVLQSAKESKGVTIKVDYYIEDIDVSSSVTLYSEDKKDIVELLEKIKMRKLGELKEQGFDFHDEYKEVSTMSSEDEECPF